MMIQGVMFDMDGILLNTERIGCELLMACSAGLGYPQVDEHVYTRMLGRSYEADRQIMMEVCGPDYPYDHIWEVFKGQLMDTVLSDRDVLKPGLCECFAGLKARGLKLALATSTPRPTVERYIAHLEPFHNAFDAVVCGLEAGEGKPAPDIYLEAARRMGVSPECCVGVEDSYAGLQSLTAAGCVRVMIPDMLPCDGPFLPLVDYRLTSLAQLPTLIDRLNLGGRLRG